MKFPRLPARLVLSAIVLMLFVPAAVAQNSYQLFSSSGQNVQDNPDFSQPYNAGNATSFNSTQIDVSCPDFHGDSGGPSAMLSSDSAGQVPVFTDNFINLTTGTGDGQSTRNVCYGGYSDTNPPVPGTDCFSTSYPGSGRAAAGATPIPASDGVGPLNIKQYLSPGVNHLKFDLMDFGGLRGNSNVYLVTNCGKATQTTLHFDPGTNVQQQGTNNCGEQGDDGACSNPNASSIKVTFDKVVNPLDVNITFTEVQGDGKCTVADGDANDSVAGDFDCTMANFFGDVSPTYGSGPPYSTPFTFPAGQVVHVPYCLHYTADNTCEDIDAEFVGSPQSGTDYTGFIHLYVAWNATTASLFPALGGPWGSDNTVSPQLYDAPHNDLDTTDYPPAPPGYPYSPTDLQKVFNVTGYYNPDGIAGKDGGVGTGPPSGVKTLNHYVVAFPLAPPDLAKLLLPLPVPTTPCFVKGIPVPLSFDVDNATTHLGDPNALVPPHYVRAVVLQGGVYQNAGNFTIQHLFGDLYGALVPTKNLSTNTPAHPYTLQVMSDLFKQPLTKNFIVQNTLSGCAHPQ